MVPATINKIAAIVLGFIQSCMLKNFSALDQAYQNHHHSDDKQDVNEATHRTASNDTEQPEDDQDDSNEIEHKFYRVAF